MVISLGYIPRNGNVGSEAKCLFKSFDTDTLPSGNTNLYSNPQCVEVANFTQPWPALDIGFILFYYFFTYNPSLIWGVRVFNKLTFDDLHLLFSFSELSFDCGHHFLTVCGSMNKYITNITVDIQL